ncbi:MAG TPA: response regulator [Gemmatimonadaceae bacterium]|nr:response regulator [Gemmatimonadaceae bacterium]
MPPDQVDRKQTILVADDHEDTRVILRHYFEAMGYNVLEAHDGEQTLESMKGCHPDAVVLDIQMPRMDGIQVLRAVRSNGALRDIRVLALSAHALSDEVRQIREAGADAYLAKPADPKAVLDAVRSLMNQDRGV